MKNPKRRQALLALGAGPLGLRSALAAGGQDHGKSGLNTMNVPPTDGIRVSASELQALVAAILGKVPIPEQDAQLVARLLVDTDLRGVVSHGVTQVERYVRSYQAGRTNPRPKVRMLRDGPATASYSGDGGLGMIVATEAMGAAIAKARKIGVGVTTATYHAHIGSSGKYVRMALHENFVGMCFSGRNAAPEYNREGTVLESIQGSPPLAFGAPAGPGHPYFMLDMASHVPWDEETFRKLPALYFKSLGLSHIANILSGTLGGQMLPEFNRRNTRYRDADQSSFFLALEITRFVPLQAFLGDMDHLMEEVSRMKPLPGFSSADLPGGPEWKREKAYRKQGVPISAATQKSLEGLAKEFQVRVPWTDA